MSQTELDPPDPTPQPPLESDEDRLRQLFRQEADQRTQAILQALESVERGNPADPDTLTTLYREAHTLKGAAGVMGQQDIYEVAAAMEATLRQAKESGSLTPAATTDLIQATQRLISLVQGR